MVPQKCSGRWPQPSHTPPPCRAARLAALGLLHSSLERWQQRLAVLDVLLARLGLPALHALLVLAPSPAAAAAMAEAAVEAAGGSAWRGDGQDGSGSAWGGDGDRASGGSGHGSSGGSGGGAALEGWRGQQLGPEVAPAVRWWRARLRTSSLPVKAVQALQERGLDGLLQQGGEM